LTGYARWREVTPPGTPVHRTFSHVLVLARVPILPLDYSLTQPITQIFNAIQVRECLHKRTLDL
jgi:hypothetical protein